MSVKKIPMRMCIGCREMKPKNELIRVVKTPDGEIKLDFTGKQSGRGAYICKCSACLKRAQKVNSFAKAFEAAVPVLIYERLSKELEKIEE